MEGRRAEVQLGGVPLQAAVPGHSRHAGRLEEMDSLAISLGKPLIVY